MVCARLSLSCHMRGGVRSAQTMLSGSPGGRMAPFSEPSTFNNRTGPTCAGCCLLGFGTYKTLSVPVALQRRTRLLTRWGSHALGGAPPTHHHPRPPPPVANSTAHSTHREGACSVNSFLSPIHKNSFSLLYQTLDLNPRHERLSPARARTCQPSSTATTTNHTQRTRATQRSSPNPSFHFRPST